MGEPAQETSDGSMVKEIDRRLRLIAAALLAVGLLVYLAAIIAGVAAGRNTDTTDVVFLGLFGFILYQATSGKMSASTSDVATLDRRLRRIEGLLELIARRLEITPEEIEGVAKQSVSAEVAKLAAEGKKIQAIKLLREQEGLGLAEAKRAVDHL